MGTQQSFHNLTTGHDLPEYLQRSQRARESNIAMAQRRLLDRETYKGLRQYIRCPVDRLELERNARWALLRAALKPGHRWSRPHMVSQLRGMRAHRGQALSHVIAIGGRAVEYVGEPMQTVLL